jgi:hypothetical protein
VSETHASAEDVKEFFFDWGTQYYTAGRWACLNGLMPTAGNSLHHAVEMYLKGCLCDVLTEGQRKGIGHALPSLWSALKARHHDKDLDSHDGVIVKLHEFESLRYPEVVARDGMNVQFSVSVQPEGRLFTRLTLDGRSWYALPLNGVDALVAALFRKARVNPEFFMLMMRVEARDYLSKDNVTGIWTIQPGPINLEGTEA